MSALAVFLSTFVSVFALGFQSRNVNQGHYVAASLTSLAICAGTLVLYRVLPNPDWMEIAGYVLGANLGILASIYVHERTLSRKPAWPPRNLRGRLVWPPPLDEHAAQHYPACIHCGINTGKSCPRLVCERWDEPTRH